MTRRQRDGGRTARRVVAIVLLLALVAALAGAIALVRREQAPEPSSVSCAPYGLEDVSAPQRFRAAPGGDGAFDLARFRSPEAAGDRFDLEFEHDGLVSRYHVLTEGVDWSRPVGVVYRLHGDGAFEFDSPEYNVSCLADVARDHNMILVVPRTPDATGEITWWEERDRNAEWLHALVRERILADYDLDPARTWWTGYSGGAQLIAQELLADHLELLPGGGAIMLGGGQAPAAPADRPTAGQLRDLRLHWDVGRDDDGSDPRARFDALSAARAGHRWYERAGYEGTSLRVREGVDHFELPDARILEQVLTRAEEAGAGTED